VTSVAFAADERHILATGSIDGTAVLWDVADPTHPHRLGYPAAGHTGAVLSVAFAADGRTLATGSVDNTAILWDVGGLSRLPEDASAIARQRAGRGLTEAEWTAYIPDFPFQTTC
jgi:WD40 repeat protein